MITITWHAGTTWYINSNTGYILIIIHGLLTHLRQAPRLDLDGCHYCLFQSKSLCSARGCMQFLPPFWMCVCVCVRARACACVHASKCVCVWGGGGHARARRLRVKKKTRLCMILFCNWSVYSIAQLLSLSANEKEE